MFSKYSKRFVKSVDNRPCLGCYEAEPLAAESDRNKPRGGLAKNHSPESDGYSSAALSKRKARSVHFETSSSFKETPPSSIRTHRYNLRSSPTEHCCCEEPESRICNAIYDTPLEIQEEDAGDYFENEVDENSNLVPKAGLVSARKRSIEERIERQQSMMSAQSRSASCLLAPKERKYRFSFQYYLAKLSVLCWQWTDYLIYDLFNYYNRVRIGGHLLVLFVLLLAHALLNNVLITEDHQKQFESAVDDLFRLFPQQSWSTIPARIGAKVLNVF